MQAADVVTDQTKRRELYRRWFEAVDARNLSQAEEVAEEMCHKDYMLYDPNLPNYERDYGRGPEGVKRFARRFLEDNSCSHCTIEDFFGEGDKTAIRFTVRETSASTGKTVTTSALAIQQWAGDKVVEEREIGGPPEEQA